MCQPPHLARSTYYCFFGHPLRLGACSRGPLQRRLAQLRSQPEIYLYQTLKALGISFAPLAVFVRGGAEYWRIEPDFVILKDGILLIVEADGDTYHRETPSEAHNRTTMLAHEGASIERINASQCDTSGKATTCAKRLLGVIAKLKDARR